MLYRGTSQKGGAEKLPKDTTTRIKPDENKLLDLEFSQNKTNIVYKEVILMATWAVPQFNFIKNSAPLPVQKLLT